MPGERGVLCGGGFVGLRGDASICFARRVNGAASTARRRLDSTRKAPKRTQQQTRAKASDALEKAKACTALAQAKAAAPSLGAQVKTRRWPSLHLKLNLWPFSTFKEHAVSALTGISQSVD